MANSFAELKNSRKENFEKLQAELAKMASGGQKFVKESEDERFWQPTADKDGCGSAVVRFLPSPKGEESPIVRVFSHSFEGPHGWYIEKSLTTFTDDEGNPKPDPVAAMNRKLWQMGDKSEGQRFVSGDNTVKPNIPGSKRKLGYYTNIYIVKDPAKPENNGTVKIWKFGARIKDKIDLASHPKFPDVEAFDPFDLFGGANFKLKFAPNEKGFRQYTESSWDVVEGDDAISRPKGPLFKDEEKMEKVWLQAHSLFQFIDPNTFKSYNQLEERLQRVMGDKFNLWKQTNAEDFKETLPPWESKEAQETNSENQSEPSNEGEPGEDELAWFRDLTKEVA